jgi:hypothetical protein
VRGGGCFRRSGRGRQSVAQLRYGGRDALSTTWDASGAWSGQLGSASASDPKLGAGKCPWTGQGFRGEALAPSRRRIVIHSPWYLLQRLGGGDDLGPRQMTSPSKPLPSGSEGSRWLGCGSGLGSAGCCTTFFSWSSQPKRRTRRTRMSFVGSPGCETLCSVDEQLLGCPREIPACPSPNSVYAARVVTCTFDFGGGRRPFETLRPARPEILRQDLSVRRSLAPSVLRRTSRRGGVSWYRAAG